MARNRLEDLVLYEPDARSEVRQAFLSEAVRRLDQGMQMYTCTENGRLACCIWLLLNQHEKVQLPGIGRDLCLPFNSAVLFDLYLDPRTRQRALHQRALSHICADLVKLRQARYIWLVAPMGNLSLRFTLQKLGFELDYRFRQSPITQQG